MEKQPLHLLMHFRVVKYLQLAIVWELQVSSNLSKNITHSPVGVSLVGIPGKALMGSVNKV